jgi:hypothetical protein
MLEFQWNVTVLMHIQCIDLFIGGSKMILCASVLVKYFVRVLCTSVLVKYFVRVLCTRGRCCGDWGIMSIIYRIYTTGSV